MLTLQAAVSLRTGAQGGNQCALGPFAVLLVHLVFLLFVIVFAHHPAEFISAFLLSFLDFARAYKQYQNELIRRNDLLAPFFLRVLVAVGSL